MNTQRRGAAEAPEEDMSTMELALEAQAERTTAAAYLLRYRTAEAKAILKETAKGKGLVAFESSEALKRWEEGTWALDPE